MPYLKKIAIVGGSGQAGRHIVEALVASGKFILTAITREESSSTFPSAVKVRKGNYHSSDFLVTALQGQNVLIILLGGMTRNDVQSRLVGVAAQASVPWILPCEFSPDTSNPAMGDSLPVFASKKRYRDEIEALGRSSWIGFVTGLWFDYSIPGWGYLGSNIKERTLKLYDDGTTKISTTTLPQVGRGVAKLLELPASTLERYRNNFVYIQSFNVSQMDMLRALEQATGTTEKDWQITKVPVDEAIAHGREEVMKGNWKGMADVLYGTNFKEGMGGCYKEKSSNAVLGLEEESLDEVVAEIVRKTETN